jgi:integrase/recombinase XerD
MQNVKISIHNRNFEARKETLKKWKISEQDKKDLIEFLNELSLGQVNQGKKISEVRQLKYLDILKIPFEYFKKPISKLTLKDIEDFEKSLSSNKLKSFKGTPFADATKVDIRRALKIYLGWKLGDKARKLTGWFDLRLKKKTPDYLSEEEVTKIYKSCKSAEERFLIAVLFDSGARAEEFHNIRYEDIQLPNEKEGYVKITLKEEYSKTKGRVISLYWKYSLEAVREYLQERMRDGIRSTDVIFANKYDNMRQFLIRLGKKVLNKSIHYHLFRHSSATYYATRLNRQELCYRYGWAFSSDMPDIYISRSGMENKQLDEKFKATELEDLQRKFEKEKLSKDLEMDELKKQLAAEIEERKKETEAKIKEAEARLRAEEEKTKKENENKELVKEVDWDDMVFRRMVENPKLAPKIVRAMKKVWGQMEEEEKTKAKSK